MCVAVCVFAQGLPRVYSKKCTGWMHTWGQHSAGQKFANYDCCPGCQLHFATTSKRNQLLDSFGKVGEVAIALEKTELTPADER